MLKKKELKNIDPKKFYSVSHAAKIVNCCRQNIYLAFRRNRLVLHFASFGKARFNVLGKDLIAYFNNLHDHTRTLNEETNEPIFKKPYYSVSQISVLSKIPSHMIYYAIYHKKIQFSRYNNKYIIFVPNIKKFSSIFHPKIVYKRMQYAKRKTPIISN